jgi:hypothetical protein
MDQVLKTILRSVAQGDAGNKRMSAAIERFASFSRLSGEMLA